jgi:conjugal transfer pilus assembly protein TraD
MPWRTTYEAYACAGWLICLGMFAYMFFTAALPKLPFVYLSVIAAIFCGLNAFGAYRVWRLKWNLGGKGISFITDSGLKQKLKLQSGAMWLGKGFEWTPVHTQRLYEIKRADPRQFYPPPLVMWFQEALSGEEVGASAPEFIGAPWIHGVEPEEIDLFVPIQNLIGNTLIVGTTRCGKTRLMELMAEMAIALGYTVIMIDPKGDQAMEQTCRLAAQGVGRARDFVRLHLAFPRESVRIDPLKNYTNPSDLASRISALMPGGDRSSSFRDFAWGVLNAIVIGMLDLGEKPTLVRIRSYVDTGVADLLIRVLLRYFDAELTPMWEREVAAFAQTLKQPKGKANEEGNVQVRESLNLLVSYYLEVLKPKGMHSETVEALATIYKHDSAHYSKMIATLVPILGMLTTGELGPLLSPDARDVTDTRPMTDLQALIHSNAIVYIGLDALANKTISSAVGSMLLSDATSVAATIYNFEDPAQEQRKVFLMVDEAAEVVNDPYIAMLNKSAGAGFINVAAAQTISDLAARFESMDKARQMLGNFNNVIAMRIKDGVTQEFVTETFGRTYVHAKQVIMGSTTSTDRNIAHFNGSVQERVSETLDDMLPAEVLGQLPNWQYIAAVSGGRLLKGRLPIIQHES